jgi:hypothetical protein
MSRVASRFSASARGGISLLAAMKGLFPFLEKLLNRCRRLAKDWHSGAYFFEEDAARLARAEQLLAALDDGGPAQAGGPVSTRA